MKYDPFIYGKNKTRGVTSVEIDGDKAVLYTDNGLSTVLPHIYFILYANKENDNCFRLNGDLHYCWAERFFDKKQYQAAIGMAKGLGIDHYVVYNDKESFLIRSGVTYYKGMEPKDVSVLSFDIETTGLDPVTNKVLMISNTFRRGFTIERRLFTIDEYKTEKEMIYAWCSYLCDRNPSVLVGHNLFGFDLPFLKKRCGTLPIGRLRGEAKFAKYNSEFRKDGSQSYTYTNVLVPGREVVDTFHLALKYDTGRNYPSYGLKPIIKHEGLEVSGRQHWDFKDGIPETGTPEWDTFKKYAEHDADDALALFDLMIPAYFYYCQHIPKTMQQVVNSATGSQINSFMVRAYLTQKHSIPKATKANGYEGAISFGNPGIYKHVGKVDVASLYPSIILTEKIYDRHKDPNGYFLKMVDYFTTERLENKRLAKETGDRKYRDLEQAQKIVINSAYGFMGAPGLNFNSPDNAALVTRKGREILRKGIAWAEAKGWQIVNADTDSFSFTTGNMFPPGVFTTWIEELNAIYPKGIVWENDGMYKKFIVVKAKNYILEEAKTGKLTVKGSALKATMKEPALQYFIKDLIGILLEEQDDISNLYMDYARICCNLSVDNIAGWCSKKTVTKAVLAPKRTNEQRVLDAIKAAQKQVSEGDKIYIFFKTDTELCLREAFDGTYSRKKLLGKLFKTAQIFKSIVSMDMFPNLTLKKNQGLLKELTAPATGDLQPGGQS